MREDDVEKVAQARGYSKGYAAGRRRLGVEHQREHRDALREDFIQRMMIAVASQMIARPWGKTIDGEWKAHTGAVAIMGSVRTVAEEAARRCSFEAAAAIEARNGKTPDNDIRTQDTRSMG